MTRVLLVADAAWVVNDVRATLTVGEWDLEVLPDPDQAATRVRESSPDCILIDLQVGSMGGMAVVRDILADLGVAPRPRIVLMLDRSADTFLARRAGADAWVVKPFEAHALRSALIAEEAAL